MRHARSDYDRIQDPEGKIPEDEPVFLIRGQDKAGPFALEAWAAMAEAYGADNEIVLRAREHAARMRIWQAHAAAKVPDLPLDPVAFTIRTVEATFAPVIGPASAEVVAGKPYVKVMDGGVAAEGESYEPVAVTLEAALARWLEVFWGYADLGGEIDRGVICWRYPEKLKVLRSDDGRFAIRSRLRIFVKGRDEIPKIPGLPD